MSEIETNPEVETEETEETVEEVSAPTGTANA